MVPIHYFLALLAVLVSLMGCTQKAPPGSRQQLLSQNSTELVDQPQVLLNNDELGIRPSSVEVSGVWVDQNSSKRLLVTGQDAQNLFELLEVESVKGTSLNGQEITRKAGINYRCQRAKNYHCVLILDAETGSLLAFKDQSELKIEPATKVLHDSVKGIYFSLDPVEKKTARMFIAGENGKKIFDSLKVANDRIEKQEDTLEYRDQVIIKGENVSCLKSVLKSTGEELVTCTFYFNYNNGSFDQIQ